MPWNDNNTYTPRTFDEILAEFVTALNATLGTDYTTESIVGTDLYRMYYPTLQLAMECDNSTALITEKMRNFFIDTNQRISESKITDDAITEEIKALGFDANVRANDASNAGNLAVCANLDNTAGTFEQDKINVANVILSNSFGGVAYEGTESVPLTLSNGQARTVKFSLATKQDTMLRITITPSNNSTASIETESEIANKLTANIEELYGLGLDFEPERYFEINRDAPYASNILLEYSIDAGANWESEPKVNTYDYLMIITNIEVVYDI